MITLFNRAELLITYDPGRFSQARDTLSQAGIDYRYRTKDLTSPTSFPGGTRSRSGNFGISQSSQIEYKLYVRKDDLSRAQSLIR